MMQVGLLLWPRRAHLNCYQASAICSRNIFLRTSLPFEHLVQADSPSADT